MNDITFEDGLGEDYKLYIHRSDESGVVWLLTAGPGETAAFALSKKQIKPLRRVLKKMAEGLA